MKFWWRLALSLSVLGVLLWILPWSEMSGAVFAIRWWVWLGVVGLFLVGHAVGAMKWRLMVNLDRPGLGVARAIRCYAAGLFANLCLPSIVGGDVLRGTMAARTLGRWESVVWGSIADRLLDVSALALLIASALVLNRQIIPGVGAEAVLLVVLAGSGVAIGSLMMMSRRPIRRWPQRMRRPVGRSLVALRRLVRRPGHAAAALALSLSIQTLFVLLNAGIGREVGIAVPVSQWFLVWPLAKLAGLIPISLNGFGVRDATQGALFAAIGVSAVTGVAASLVWQSVLVVGGVMAGLYWWGIAPAAGRLAAMLRGTETRSA